MSGFEVELFPEPIPVELFGHMFYIPPTVVTSWGIIAVVLVLALAFRFLVLPRLKDRPRGLQMLLESAVEALDNYVGSKVHGMGDAFGGYIFTVAVLLVFSALAEALGLRAPSSDPAMTLGLSAATFILFNYYGFRRKGLLGRAKRFANPFNILSDVVAPLSMACRLFGNMFGGMIIMELIYMAMGRFALVLPSVAGLYFNIFHPLIQAFIFITLTLSYVEEATE